MEGKEDVELKRKEDVKEKVQRKNGDVKEKVQRKKEEEDVKMQQMYVYEYI